MNYNAHGYLLGCYRLEKRERTDSDLYLILVEWGQQYVVARYLEGQPEWTTGRYFNSHSDATELFASQIQATL